VKLRLFIRLFNNYIYPICSSKHMTLLLGIDEAGRGPVIGPMVLCGVIIDASKEKQLKDMGARDSKMLTPLQRERLFDEIIDFVKGYKLIIVQPQEIDAAVESETDNLNWLEAKKSAEIINALKPNTAILDCPTVNTKKYTDYINKLLNVDLTLIAEHKADANYPVVSAASILAKVTRDAEIEKIKQKINIDFGSGYPSDPRTQEFLKKYHKKFPEIFRKSWASWKEVHNKQGQARLFDF
jgi:ribonuclease HII